MSNERASSQPALSMFPKLRNLLFDTGHSQWELLMNEDSQSTSALPSRILSFVLIVTPRGVRQEINLSAERCTTEQTCYLCSLCWFGICNQSPHWSSKMLPRLEQSHCFGGCQNIMVLQGRAGLLIAELRVGLGLSTANSGVATLVCFVNWFAPVTALQETIVPCFDCKENRHHSCGKRKWSGCSKNRDSSGAKEKQKEPS